MICPNCGNDTFYVNLMAVQYYDSHGEPAGYEIQNSSEKSFVKCTQCNKKVSLFTLTGMLKRKKTIKKYIGSFWCNHTYYLIGFKAKNEDALMNKIKKIRKYGWEYDGIYSPLREVDDFPSYVYTTY